MKPFTLLAVSSSLMLWGCQFRTLDEDLSGTALSETATEDFCTDYHWGYEGDHAPDTWSICYGTCGGDAQSPVDIWNPLTDNSLQTIHPDYEEVPTDIINNGHTVECEYEPGSILMLNGLPYELLQFHFHAGSEHTVRGKQYPLEVHLVHRNVATGKLAVIGVFFQRGRSNPILQTIMDHMPLQEGDHYASAAHIDADNLLPDNRTYYTYSGSLTTPPCSEIVTWIVMDKPIFASQAQLDAFDNVLHDNFRPVQPINGRTIRKRVD
ncbi:MAG TPA: carbonic anhydrase family protein [Flavilitoribacter sp.]|nr:carbonic anhydrase family protein [Flavilitoribacter sp.]HMQ86496.1 carbonic anhydrase family protein [Flavilitoribacter sp.]